MPWSALGLNSNILGIARMLWVSSLSSREMFYFLERAVEHGLLGS